MKEYSEEENEMQCPSCGSHATQSVSMAYAQSARTGSSGYESISVLGEQIAPPKKRDEEVWPTIAVCITAITALFKLPGALNHLEIEALRNLSSLSWPVAALSCAIGWFAGAVFAIPAICYNRRTLPGLKVEWQMWMICKRCAHRWRRIAPRPEISKEHDHDIR